MAVFQKHGSGFESVLCFPKAAPRIVCFGGGTGIGGSAGPAFGVTAHRVNFCPHDPAGETAYPIVTYTWMLFYKKYDDAQKVQWIHKLVDYCLTTGQKISDKAGYIALPEAVVKQVQAAAKNIQ